MITPLESKEIDRVLDECAEPERQAIIASVPHKNDFWAAVVMLRNKLPGREMTLYVGIGGSWQGHDPDFWAVTHDPDCGCSGGHFATPIEAAESLIRSAADDETVRRQRIAALEGELMRLKTQAVKEGMTSPPRNTSDHLPDSISHE